MIRVKKIYVFLLILILLLPSISSNAFSQGGINNNSNGGLGLIKKILNSKKYQFWFDKYK